MAEATAGPQQRYKFVPYGGGVEEHDRFGIRDLIRQGEILPHTELALKGTDDWRPAESYAELTRYFSMVSQRPVASPGPLVAPSKPRVVQPMGQRVIQGLMYPLAGGEVFMLIGLALLSFVPILGRLAGLAATVIMVNIVRTSADGKLKMPLVDTSDVGTLVLTSLKVLFISAVSLLPVLGAIFLIVPGLISKTITLPMALAGLVVAYAISAIYYPACLATVAVWDDMLSSLNPVYVARVIRILGADYFIAIGVFFAAILGATLMKLPIAGSIPIIGSVFTSAILYWALFYASHILGYAVYRHLPELGWE
jgi:hypothetical protein